MAVGFGPPQRFPQARGTVGEQAHGLLIREGSYPGTDIEGNPIPSLSGIPGAVPFISDDVFFWISTANVVPGDYPPNSSLAPTS